MAVVGFFSVCLLKENNPPKAKHIYPINRQWKNPKSNSWYYCSIRHKPSNLLSFFYQGDKNVQEISLSLRYLSCLTPWLVSGFQQNGCHCLGKLCKTTITCGHLLLPKSSWEQFVDIFFFSSSLYTQRHPFHLSSVLVPWDFTSYSPLRV